MHDHSAPSPVSTSLPAGRSSAPCVGDAAVHDCSAGDRSRHRARRFTPVAAALLGALAALVAVPDGASARTLEVECRSAIESSMRRWVTQGYKARQRCLSGVVLGSLRPGIDCVGGTGDPDLEDILARSDARLLRTIDRSCGDIEWSLLSYPGPCSDDANNFDAGVLARCIRERGGFALERLFQSAYPPVVAFSRPPESQCMVGAGSRSFAMFSREMRLRLRCLMGQQAGTVSTAIDCTARIKPDGPGTGEARLDAAIVKAHLAWLASMPRGCAFADLDGLGYGLTCPDPSGPPFGLFDLRSCVYDTNVAQLPILLDVAFPSDPVCGNGFLQEGEECDDGALNSDTAGDACRKDCTLPRCGDGARDPGLGEECDDGNLLDRDGCNAMCKLEFCGDGLVNGKPLEECDDGNAIANDTCTNQCRVATCGDGVICNRPGCTSGPGGGLEQCDNGAQNGDDKACRSDCSGFPFTCTLTVGVTSTNSIGALLYTLDYGAATGEFLGKETAVKCTSLVQGGLSSFFDDEPARELRQSLIANAGFSSPAAIASCSFASPTATQPTSAFSITVKDATSPTFQPIQPVLAVQSIVCTTP